MDQMKLESMVSSVSAVAEKRQLLEAVLRAPVR